MFSCKLQISLNIFRTVQLSSTKEVKRCEENVFRKVELCDFAQKKRKKKVSKDFAESFRFQKSNNIEKDIEYK